MKKAIFGIVLLTLLFATSCKKTSNGTTVIGPGGSWTFEGASYAISSGIFYPFSGVNAGVLNGVDSATFGFPKIQIVFPDSTPPTMGGTYTVVPSGIYAISGHVAVSLYYGGQWSYQPTSNGGNQKVTVSVSPTGKLSVSGTGIEMVNLYSPYDSAACNFNIIQTQ